MPVLRGLSGGLTREHIVVSTVVPMTSRRRLFYWTPLQEGEASLNGRRSAAESI